MTSEPEHPCRPAPADPQEPMTFDVRLSLLDNPAATLLRDAMWMLTTGGWQLSGWTHSEPCAARTGVFQAKHLRAAYPDGYTETLVVASVSTADGDGHATDVRIYTANSPTWTGGAR